MAKIDTMSLSSENFWISLGTDNIFEMTISNSSTNNIDAVFDFAIGPNTQAAQTTDTDCIYFLKNVNIPFGVTLTLDELFLKQTFSGQKIFSNTVTAGGKFIRSEMSDPTFLVRTGGDPDQELDLIIARK